MRRLRAIDIDPDIRLSLRVIEQLCVYLQTHPHTEYDSRKDSAGYKERYGKKPGSRLLKITRCTQCELGVHAAKLA